MNTLFPNVYQLAVARNMYPRQDNSQITEREKKIMGKITAHPASLISKDDLVGLAQGYDLPPAGKYRIKILLNSVESVLTVDNADQAVTAIQRFFDKEYKTQQEEWRRENKKYQRDNPQKDVLHQYYVADNRKTDSRGKQVKKEIFLTEFGVAKLNLFIKGHDGRIWSNRKNVPVGYLEVSIVSEASGSKAVTPKIDIVDGKGNVTSSFVSPARRKLSM